MSERPLLREQLKRPTNSAPFLTRIYASALAVYFVIELMAAIYFSSLVLFADAFHNFSDVMAAVVTFKAAELQSKEDAKFHPFGYVRTELLGGFSNCVFLVSMCFYIILESIPRFWSPEHLHVNGLFVGVAAGGVAINAVGMFLFCYYGHEILPCAHSHGHDDHGHSHGHDHEELKDHNTDDVSTFTSVSFNEPNAKRSELTSSPTHKHGGGCSHDHGHKHEEEGHSHAHGHHDDDEEDCDDHHNHANNNNSSPENLHGVRTKNTNYYAMFLHLAGDTVNSFVILLFALCMWMFDKKTGEADWTDYLDPALSAFISFFLIYSCVGVIKDTTSSLLVRQPKVVNGIAIKRDMLAINGVVSVQKLVIVEIAVLKTAAFTVVICKKDAKLEQVDYEIKRILYKFGFDWNVVELHTVGDEATISNPSWVNSVT